MKVGLRCCKQFQRVVGHHGKQYLIPFLEGNDLVYSSLSWGEDILD